MLSSSCSLVLTKNYVLMLLGCSARVFCQGIQDYSVFLLFVEGLGDDGAYWFYRLVVTPPY